MCNTAEVPRQKIPKDGVGPRGVPDCYYTSRVLNSTFRYAKFVRKLRAEEEEQRKGAENKAKEARDNTINDFFLRCDRRSLINDVARRVDLCMTSYQEDLKLKRQKLKEILEREEEESIRKFVEQAQAGAEALWQEKKDRLQYLLDKRKEEHAEKYKDTPLSKCAHVLPCVFKLRAKEAQEIQLYQMKEKQARRAAEAEFDKMWHEVTMKEADALAARMEHDAIERYRKDQDCKMYSDYELEQKRLRREREKELLKQETLKFRAMWEMENRKAEEEERVRKERALEVAEEQKKLLAEQRERLERERAHEKVVSEAWDSLAEQGIADEKAQIELRKRKERELDECNRRLLELKGELARLEILDEAAREGEAARGAEKADRARCQHVLWAKRTGREVSQAIKEQIKERQLEKDLLMKKKTEEEEYQRQLFAQVQQLADYKRAADAAKRKAHQNNLRKQMEYTNILKERARQEELNQLKKYKIATEEYECEIAKMLSRVSETGRRPFFSDEVHPFMKQMAKGMKLTEKCPCSKSDYCK
ncbi:unnamed protein product, partial [Iphiclides podalirius]